MHLSRRRSVPAKKQVAGPSVTDWDLVRIFLEVVRQGSLRGAADRLGMSVNRVRNRISQLENAYNVALLTRHIDGIRLTAEGKLVHARAREMREAAVRMSRTFSEGVPTVSGEVKFAVTEGLGTFWVTPRLIEFQRAYPELLVDLKCEMRSADVLRLEADVSVQLEKPQSPDLKVVKIGRLHSMPFVSASYVETYGTPKSLDDIIENHKIVLQVAEQTRTAQLYQKLARGRDQVGFVSMRTNVSSALVWAVSKGAGVGWLPTYVPAISGNLIPLDIGSRFQFDIWLAYHAEARRIPRVKRMIEWTIEAFDGKKYPWFRNEFVHPKDLARAYRGQPLVNLFAGFTSTAAAQV